MPTIHFANHKLKSPQAAILAPHPLKWGPREGVWPSWGEEKPRHRWNFPLAGNETLCLVLRRAGGGTFLFRQESTQRDDLGGGGGRDVKHPNTASPQDPPLVGRSVVRTENRCGIIAPSLRGLSADQADWGSVLLKNDTPSVFGYAKSTSLREGGYFIAACGDVILRCKMTGPSGRPVPTNNSR